MAKRSSSGGGAATSAGTTFQEDVACYFSTLILSETAADVPFGLPANVHLTAIVAETAQPIDDLVVTTSSGGVLCIQAKTSVSISNDPKSPFGQVVRQFVRQRMVGVRPVGSPQRATDLTRDRFVLAVGPKAPSRVRVALREILDKCRSLSNADGLAGLIESLNKADADLLKIVRQQIQVHWGQVQGVAPTLHDELSILQAGHVLELDFRQNGAARTRARDLLRTVVLRDTKRVDDAWNALTSICRSFGPNRTGGDLASIRSDLERWLIPLRTLHSYESDVQRLKEYSERRRQSLRRLSITVLGNQEIKIPRDAVQALTDFAAEGHTAVIGEPGAGKSGCLHDFVEDLVQQQIDVVLLAADMIEASSPETLAKDIGLSEARGLVDVLHHWSGADTGYLVVDALDAARSGMSLHVLCEILKDAQERAPRWRIVASIREYDLRVSPEVQDLFAGSSHARFHSDRFPLVRHIRVPRLSARETEYLRNHHKPIDRALSLSASLADLITNPFNLSLLCKLLDTNVDEVELGRVETQIGLLSLYWERRVKSRHPIQRITVLRAFVNRMVEERSLHTDLASCAGTSGLRGLEELLHDGTVVEVGRRTNGSEVYGFAHNILFDFAVSRLWLEGLTDSTVSKLAEPQNHDLLLAIRPSFVMSFEELWIADDARAEFWDRASALQQESDMRLIGKTIACGVAAEQFKSLEDAQILLGRIRQRNETSVELLRYTIQAALAHDGQAGSTIMLVGEGAASWMELAATLSDDVETVAWEIRALLRPMIQYGDRATSAQSKAANTAAISLLKFGLSDSRFHAHVRVALEVVASTIDSNPQESSEAVAAVLSPEHLEVGAHEWLHPLASRLPAISRASPDLALRIVSIVFGVSGDRSASVPMGGRLLPMSMNKYDLVRMARHDVQEVFPSVWDCDPVTATRMVVAAVTAVFQEEHEQPSDSAPATSVSFRGKSATIRPDASHIWATGEHNRHEEWNKLLATLKSGLRQLAKDRDRSSLLLRVLDTIRDDAELAVVWNAVLEAAVEEPQSLGVKVSELLTVPEVLALPDTRRSAGALIESCFQHLNGDRRAEVEAAIIRIPKLWPDEPDYGEHIRNRLLGCVRPDLLESAELIRLREELKEAGGPPPNVADFRVTSRTRPTSRHWMLRQQGVDVEAEAVKPVLALYEKLAAVGKSTGPGNSKPLDEDELVCLLNDAKAVVEAEHANHVEGPATRQLEDEVINVCERLAAREASRRSPALLDLIRQTLLQAAQSERPEFHGSDNDRWDNETAGWGSPSPRVDSAMGLMHLAADSETVDREILASIAKLAKDEVPAVRYQVLVHCTSLYRTAPEQMWSLVRETCKTEPRAAILNLFCANAILQLPAADHAKVESSVRILYRRSRRKPSLRVIRKHCATFYTKAAIWRNDRRANRYLDVFADSPLHFSTEASRISRLCRGLLRFDEDEDSNENARVRSWAFRFLTKTVQSIRTDASALRRSFADQPFDQWTPEAVQDLQTLHQLAHNVATQVYFASGASDEGGSSGRDAEDSPPATDREKAAFLAEGSELFDALCDIEFVESAYDVLRTLEFLSIADHADVIRRIALIVRRAKEDGIHYESMAADLVVRIVERYLSEYGNLFREDPNARDSLLDILDVFVAAGWPNAMRLTYRLGEVFR